MGKPKFDDEICECGHSKGYHKAHPEDAHAMQTLDEHGAECEKCSCTGYTWSKMVVYKEWKP